MKMCIVAPVYPPEIADAGILLRQFAKVAALEHQVTVVAYSRKQEEQGVHAFFAMDKHKALASRLLDCFIAVWRAAEKNGVILTQASLATSFPCALVSWLRGIPLYIQVYDDEYAALLAQKTNHRSRLRHWAIRHLRRYVLKQASAIVFPTEALRQAFFAVGSIDEKATHIVPLPSSEMPILPFVYPEQEEIVVYGGLRQQVSGIQKPFFVYREDMSREEAWIRSHQAKALVLLDLASLSLEDLRDLSTVSCPMVYLKGQDISQYGLEHLSIHPVDGVDDIENAVRSLDGRIFQTFPEPRSWKGYILRMQEMMKIA